MCCIFWDMLILLLSWRRKKAEKQPCHFNLHPLIFVTMITLISLIAERKKVRIMKGSYSKCWSTFNFGFSLYIYGFVISLCRFNFLIKDTRKGVLGVKNPDTIPCLIWGGRIWSYNKQNIIVYSKVAS